MIVLFWGLKLPSPTNVIQLKMGLEGKKATTTTTTTTQQQQPAAATTTTTTTKHPKIFTPKTILPDFSLPQHVQICPAIHCSDLQEGYLWYLTRVLRRVLKKQQQRSTDNARTSNIGSADIWGAAIFPSSSDLGSLLLSGSLLLFENHWRCERPFSGTNSSKERLTDWFQAHQKCSKGVIKCHLYCDN